MDGSGARRRQQRRRRWYWLLAIPFVATLLPPLYARAEPAIGPIPFFYWYQFLWIVLTAALVGLVYVLTRE